MSAQPNFYDRLTARTPIAFPLIALAHGVWLLLAVWNYRSEPFPSAIWTQVAWHISYTLAWLLATRGLRIGAWAYIALTTANILLRFIVKDANDLAFYTDALFPFDVLFCFFLLLYYKRLQ
jgi:hypothetical protein